MAPKASAGKKRPYRWKRSEKARLRKDRAKAAVVEDEEEKGVEATKFICSTPKGMEYMIPKLETCPPAPTKRRLAGLADGRRAEGFFDHPDIELFFMFEGNNGGGLVSSN